MTATPDPERLGGLAWTRRTGGALTPRERRRLLAAIAKAQARYVLDRVRLATGHAPPVALHLEDLRPPDSALARAAEEACREQSAALIGHSYRTWAFGAGLAAVDGAPVDPEHLYVASLLHDLGLDAPVAGEDFTLRSADRAAALGAPDAVGDAITSHSTPGATWETDGAGAYVGAGAVLDLGGLRASDLPRAYRDGAIVLHPRDGLIAAVSQLVRAEAARNPKGRFALLRRCGILPLMAMTPLKPR